MSCWSNKSQSVGNSEISFNRCFCNTHAKLFKELVNRFREILIITLGNILDAVFKKLVTVKTVLQDIKGKTGTHGLSFLLSILLPKNASLEGVLFSERSPRRIFVMTAFNLCQMSPTSLSSWCWYLLLVFSHLVWALPCSWCDERFLKLNPGHLGH